MINTINKKVNHESALKTKTKRDNIINNNTLYPCKKCGEEKLPSEFVKHYDENMLGRYQYLYECKSCKKNRIQTERSESLTSTSIEDKIAKYLSQGAEKFKNKVSEKEFYEICREVFNKYQKK